MAEVKKIRVDIDGNASGLKTATKQASGSLDKFSGQVSKMGGVLAGAFAISAITNFTKASLKAYDTQVKAETKLLTALKGREDIQKRLIQQASNLQKITLFGDEQTIEAQAFLATMGLSEDAIMKLTPLVQDLATKMGTSLTSAADLVAKSVGSSTNALSRYGITIEGAAGSNERLESAVRALNEQVGGQSEAAAKVGTGAITQLSNAMGDLQEKIGLLLSYAIIPLVENISSLVDMMSVENPMEEWFASGQLQSEIFKLGESINKLKEEHGENSDVVKQAQEFYNQLYEQLLLFIPVQEKIIKQTKELSEEDKKALEHQGEMAAALTKTGEGFILISENMFDYGYNLNILGGQIKAAVSEYEALLQAKKEQIAEDKKQAIMQAMVNKQLGITKKNTMEAAAATAALAVANRSSAKEIISAALAVATAEAIKGSLFAAKNPIVGLLLAGVAIAGVKALFSNLPEFATGTSFAPGGMALVGERGPEVVNLPKGSSVTPNHMMGGGGAGGDIVLKVGEYEFARVINIATANQGSNVARTTF